MILRSITLKNFRSYVSETFSFHPSFNLIYGDNAQGKTNLLEAIHFLLAFKPFKQVRHEEIIHFGKEESGIKGEIDSGAGLDEVHILLSGERKIVKLNGKIVYKISRILGRFGVVSFLPSDIELIKGGRQGRRRYLDSVISACDPSYLKDLKTYHRALVQRNAVLSKSRSLTPSMIEVWDDKLSEAGERVIAGRLKYLSKIEPCLNRIYRKTSGTDSQIRIIYQSPFDVRGSIREGFGKCLKASFEKDKRRGHTTAGPHRDSVGFTIGGRDASLYASQGESKNLAFALKASEIELHREILGRIPVLLLDDITSELDAGRRKFLFEMISGLEGQVFITTTGRDEILYDGPMSVFRIRKGRSVHEVKG